MAVLEHEGGHGVLGKRLRELREERGLTQVDVAKIAGVTDAAVGMWENEKRTPDPATLARLADFFGVSTDYLLGRTNNPRIHSDMEAWTPNETVLVPVLGVIRAGEPIFASENIEGYEEVPKEWVNGECFFLRVVGDSMAGARIQEGDLVFVRRQDYAENGDIVVAIVNGEDATIKRIFFTQDAIILHPENPKYKPIVLQGKERNQLTIVGKVLWFKGAVK